MWMALDDCFCDRMALRFAMDTSLMDWGSDMPQLSIHLRDEELEALREYAIEQNISVEALLDRYVAYLLAGGASLVEHTAFHGEGSDIAKLLTDGMAFDWLFEEPDVYSSDDGEPM